METLKLDYRKQYAILQFNRPKAHAINMTMVQELRETFASLAQSDHTHGVVLTGQGSIFCAGLDVVELYRMDADDLDRFFAEFGRLLVDMASFPKPMVAAINGHSPAGGCVFSLCCDYRIMADGDYKIGLNEIPVGIVPPTNVIQLAVHWVGQAKATRMLLDGLLMNPEEAFDFGLVDLVRPQEDVLLAAIERLEYWANFSAPVWQNTKRLLRASLIEELKGDGQDVYGPTTRMWWAQESRAALGAFVEKMTKKG